METPEKTVIADTFPVSGIVVLGMLLAIFGLFVQDSMGVHLIITALGIGLLISGMTFMATNGNRWVRLTNAFVSLVAAQLLAFSGVIQWVGGSIICIVGISVLYSRF